MMGPKRLSIPAIAVPVLRRLEEAGHEAYIVGGAVRDLLLERPISDVDIATSATPQMVQSIFPHTIATGLLHGTVTVVLPNKAHVEVTTYRRDGPYVDGRHPAYVSFSSDIHDDLARRDFTINAMALSIDGSLLDPFGGKAHLKQRLLCAVGNPVARFEEDALRMIRALRFAATYGLLIDPQTFQAMKSKAKGVNLVSLERVGQEMVKLSEGQWHRSLDVMVESGVWKQLPHPMAQLHDGFAQLLHWWKTVGEFGPLQPTGLTAVAAWFTLLENGSQAAAQICRKGALGRHAAKGVEKVVQLGRMILQAQAIQWNHSLLYEFGKQASKDALSVVSWLRPQEAQRLQDAYARALATQPIWGLSELAVGGEDLREMGCEGPDIGRMLQRLVTGVLQGEMPNRRDALLEIVKRQISKGMR